jgi:hypothetical protein
MSKIKFREQHQVAAFTPTGLKRVKAVWFTEFLEGLTHDERLFHTAVLACADANGDAGCVSDAHFMDFINSNKSALEQFIKDAGSATLSVSLPPYPLVVHYQRPEPHSVILCNRYHRENTQSSDEEEG